MTQAGVTVTELERNLDLEKEKVAVGVLHPGFMRTEMTKGVGYDEFYDEGHGT